MEAFGFRKTPFRHNNVYTGAQFCSQIDLHLCYTLVRVEIKHSLLKKKIIFFPSILWTSFEQKHYLQIPKLAHLPLCFKDTCTHCIYSSEKFLWYVNKSSTLQFYTYGLLQVILLKLSKLAFHLSYWQSGGQWECKWECKPCK